MGTDTNTPPEITEEEKKKKQEADAANSGDDKDKDKEKEAGGLMGFLENNTGMLGGLALGAMMMFATGGSGFLGMLLPLLLGAVAGMIMDDNGIMGGVKDSVQNMINGPDPKQQPEGIDTQAPGKTQALTVASGAQLRVTSGDRVINGVHENGHATFAQLPAGTTRGADVTIIENGMVEGEAKAKPAYLYTGHVEDGKFHITSIQSAVTDEKGAKWAAKDTLNPPVTLDIDDKGRINLTQGKDSALGKAREQAQHKSQEYYVAKAFEVTPRGEDVSIALDPVERDGVKYQTHLVGTKGENGRISFDRAVMTETQPDGTTKEVTNPTTGKNEFKLNTPIESGLNENGKALVDKGRAEITSNGMIDYTLNKREAKAAQEAKEVTTRGEELAGAIKGAPDAGQSLDKLQGTLKNQLKGRLSGNESEMKAAFAAKIVTDFYAQGQNRSEKLDTEALKEQLGSVTIGASGSSHAVFTKDEVNGIVSEMQKQHGQIAKGLNDKVTPMKDGKPDPSVDPKNVDIQHGQSQQTPGIEDTASITPGANIPGQKRSMDAQGLC
jgi:hypothetical protein